MAFLALVELLIFLFGFYVLVTQIAVPLVRGTALFPFFRRAEQHRAAVEALEDQEVALLEKEIQRLITELRADLEANAKAAQEKHNVSPAGESTNGNS